MQVSSRLVPLFIAFNKLVLVRASHFDVYKAHLQSTLPARKTARLCGREVGVYQGGWIAAHHSNDRF
jgi:hypothetical protein